MEYEVREGGVRMWRRGVMCIGVIWGIGLEGVE